jgi:hypothetical protein
VQSFSADATQRAPKTEYVEPELGNTVVDATV